MSKEENEKKLYRTTNFNIAVWLQMKSIPLVKVDWVTKRRANFVFEDFKDRATLVDDFFKQGQLQSYISVAQETKARMYAINPPVEYDRTQ